MDDLIPIVEYMRQRGAELEKLMADPDIFDDMDKYKDISREYQRNGLLLKAWDRYESIKGELADSKEMLDSEDDSDFIAEIEQEIASLQAESTKLEGKIKLLLLPPDKNDSKNIIVEINPAAGGSEAGLFAGDLFRMYLRYAERKKWKTEILELSENDVGGLKQVSFSVQGEDVYRGMHLESGVHRVQRIPTTESGGRIHTSTVTCSVLPEVEIAEFDIRPQDLRMDVFRASGAGGQHVNTTDSAVRITHIPTGVAVASQQEKSQHKNREIAMRILCARLIENERQKEQDKIDATRKSQVGTGDRSERIRTYNYPQGRVTDHRFNVSKYDLPNIMEGSIDILIDELLILEAEQKLKDLYEETKANS